MNTYKLLTPGPLTTTDTVKQEMLVDRCTWDDDYKAVTQKIRTAAPGMTTTRPSPRRSAASCWSWPMSPRMTTLPC